jgi:GDPmannose 4,6-dehydratase
MISPRGQKTALIAGVTGQDGAYLAHYLLGLGYRVVGSSRDAQMADTSRLERLGVKGDVELVSLAPNDFRSVLKVVAGVQPDEIYNLAGQTSVGLSFDQPVECLESISTATLNLLEVIRFLGGGIRFFSAGSSECFGDTGQTPATEDTPMRPGSPYAVAKASAYWQVATYREAYGMFACTGILANHESPLRPKRFVTQKIIDGVRAIKAGRQTTIQLGNLDIWRDWGWAPDYVRAMVLMLQADQPGDYLIASGTTTSLRQFAQAAFNAAGLDLGDHLESVEGLRRPADLVYSAMNPTEISQALGWKSKRTIREIVEKMYSDILF